MGGVFIGLWKGGNQSVSFDGGGSGKVANASKKLYGNGCDIGTMQIDLLITTMKYIAIAII